MTEQEYLQELINQFEMRTGGKPKVILTDKENYHFVKSLDSTMDYQGIPVIAGTDIVIKYPNFKNRPR